MLHEDGAVNISIEKNIPVMMRDGVNLLADVYRPDADAVIRSW